MSNDQDNRNALPADGLYPIRTVAAATGVNPVTLRAWESRYGLLSPKRTPKGHRLYTRDQIETIGRVTRLLSQGIAISQVRPLLDDPAENNAGPRASIPSRDNWSAFAERMTDAVARFDAAALDSVYNEALSQYPLHCLIRHLMVPALERLGACWKRSPSGIAQEHFLNAYLRNKIGARFHQHGAPGGNSPLLVAACLPGELHETGLLLFCLDAMAQGYRIVYLGANTPLDQLPPVVEGCGAAAVVLSAHSKPRTGLLSEHLPMLTGRAGVPVFLGGPGSTASEARIQDAGAVPIGIDSETALRRIALRLDERD